MFRTLLLMLIGWVGFSSALQAEFKYLRIEIVTPSNALLTEGLFARGDLSMASSTQLFSADLGEPIPPNPADPDPVVILTGSFDRYHYRLYNGAEGQLSPDRTGDVLLTAAKDSTFSAHVRQELLDDGLAGSVEVDYLVNSRERMSYDLPTDSFYYGTKVMSFPRDPGFQVVFQYGGHFDFIDADHFRLTSASGVVSDVRIVTAPEPSACLLICTAGSLTFLRRWRRVS